MQKRMFTILFIIPLLLLSTTALAKWQPAAAHLSEKGVESIMVQVDQQPSNTISLQYQIPAPNFKLVSHQNVNGILASRCFLGNAKIHSIPGEPELPYVYSRIILPQGRTVESIKIVPKATVEITERITLTYGEIPHTISSTDIEWAKPKMSIYNSNVVYPIKTHEVVDIQYRCGVAIAYLHIYPVRYMPNTGRLQYFKEFSIEITTKPAIPINSGLRVRPERFFQNYRMTEENPSMLDTYKDRSIQGGFTSNMCNPKDTYTYVAIAKQSFIDANTTPKLDDLIAHRTSEGFSCKVESIENVLANSSGSDDKNKVRNFIKEAYNNWDTKWVLLCGDAGSPEIIPCFVLDGTHPSDMPLQCLEQSSWDNDYEAEVFIGRISAEDADEVSNQIYKILHYENSAIGDPYLVTGLSCGEELDSRTYGKEAMQELAGYFSDDWTWKDLHDKDNDWSKSQLKAIINSSEISVINHLGHSNSTYNMKLRNGDERDFSNTNFIFHKTQGCIPGKFTVDCIGERFTTENRNGMFAAIMNSNNGYYSPGNPTGGSSHQVHRSLWKACWEENMERFGEFNEYSHRMNTRRRRDIIESNLFGCPAILFKGKETAPFIAVVTPNGGEMVEQNTTITIKYRDNVSGNIKIELLKGGTVASTLSTSTPSLGTFDWDVGTTATGSDYKIKVTCLDDPSLNHESVNTFSIIPEFIITDYVYFEPFDTLKAGAGEATLPFKYEQLTTDNLDWTVYKGPTPSRIDDPPDVTGPRADHTSGNGNYLYTEASASNNGNPNKTFTFTTPKFNFKALNKPELSFWYHMFSDNAGEDHMGDLILDISVDGTWKEEVIKISGNKGDNWLQQKLDLTPHKGDRVIFRFRGITGDSWESDICLDDIKIEDPGVPITNSGINLVKSYDLRYYNSKLTYRIPSNVNNKLHTSLRLYNLQGKLVKTLVDEPKSAGRFTVDISEVKNHVASGIYFAKMKVGNFNKTLKIVKK